MRRYYRYGCFLILLLFAGCGSAELEEQNQTIDTSVLGEQIEVNSSESIANSYEEDSLTPISEEIKEETTVTLTEENLSQEEENITSTLSITPPLEIPITVEIEPQSEPQPQSEPTPLTSLDYHQKFIEHNNCDQILDKLFLVICYDYQKKAAKSVAYTLEGDLMNELNIQDRPNFYEEESIQEPYRAKLADYRGSGYDRGHLAPDAAFDWSQESLEATYSLANIIPQAPIVNQQMWVDVEGYAREKAIELGSLEVVNLIDYNHSSITIGEGNVTVSTGYYKILYNQEKGYEECFYYANDLNASSSGDSPLMHMVSCRSI
jgi:endonuclease G